MNEKRFKCVFKEHETKNSWSMIKDNQLDKPLYIKDVVDLLNEQQATISALKEENEELRQELEENKAIINFCSNGDEDEDLHRLIKENEQLRQQLQEKQEDEKLYAQEILELNKTKKEMLNFKQLGGDY